MIGTDEAGEFPVLLHEGDALPGGNVRRRLIAETDDYGEAVAVADLLYRRCFTEPPSVA